jgi:hypothetical protein
MRARRSRGHVVGFVLVVAVSVFAIGLLGSPAFAATSGWAGETILSTPNTSAGGWEPAVAADPSAPYVYSAWMEYPGPQIDFRVSTNGGTSWSPEAPLCTKCGGAGQYDISLAVASNGTVFGSFMIGNAINFTSSTNHGSTWSAPVKVSAKAWGDKPWIAANGNGSDVYITYTSSGGNLYAVDSHNSGATWSLPLRLTNESGEYYYSNGGTILPNGTAVIAASEYKQSSGANSSSSGPINITVFRTSNGGTSWTRSVIDGVFTGVTYQNSSVTTCASDANGNLLLVYSGATTLGANDHVWVRTSTDSGTTWSARTEMTTSSATLDATSVAAAGTGSGIYAITWMQGQNGSPGWNVYQRQTTDAGGTWAAQALVSDSTTGAAYKTPTGFGRPYGDYDTVAINSSTETVAVMGEGNSAFTYGDIWVNHQTAAI